MPWEVFWLACTATFESELHMKVEHKRKSPDRDARRTKSDRTTTSRKNRRELDSK